MRFLGLIDSRLTVVVGALLLSAVAGACATEEGPPDANPDSQPTIITALSEALTFHASFDSGTDADFALGDRKIYGAPSYDELEKAEAGRLNPGVVLAAGEGRFGSALEFQKKHETALFYRAANNIAFSNQNWSGTLSFWLRLTPEEDLEPGFCDPIQLTDKAYNDSAIWVDFPEHDRHLFRLGVFGALDVWNPQDLPNQEHPDFQRHLVVADAPPFRGDKWTQVLITYSGLGSSAGGTASLYLDGELQGQTENISEPFEWDVAKGALRLGVNYVGFMDEFAVFSRPLNGEEIRTFYQLETGAAALHP